MRIDPWDWYRVGGDPLVYRVFDASDRLLYVGRSEDLFTRLKNHERYATWWPLAALIGVQRCATRQEAVAVEARLIKTEHPVFNRAGRAARTTDALALADAS